MSVDTYKLTSMEEPTDEVLAQLMHEATEEASRTNIRVGQTIIEGIFAGKQVKTKEHAEQILAL